jgi:glycosyltransferase involved in cell wall biosynthesis
MWCSILAHARGLRVPHVAHAFNFAHLPAGLRLRAMRKAFQRVDHFVTFSTVERDLYSKHLDIPPEKIEVVLWGVQPPVAADNSPHVPAGPYISALGGNRRDYRLLFAAMEKLPDITLVAVLRPHNLQGLSVPPNVQIRTNIPIPHAMAVLRHSRFMVLPLDAGVVPCGHVTMVSSMHLHKAFIATDSPGITDYAAHDHNALIVPPAKVDALASAIRALWNDPARTDALAANGAAFAAKHCTEEATVTHVSQLLQRMNVLPTTASPKDPTDSLRGSSFAPFLV